jgi:hypothetical protein
LIGQVFTANRKQADQAVRLLRHDGMPHAIEIAANADQVINVLADILPRWPAIAPNGPAPLRLAHRGGEFQIQSPWLNAPLSAESPVSAACALIIEMARSWLSARPGHLCLHCAAFLSHGRLIILAGTNRSGKSTLAAALGAAGVKLYCDDMLPLTPNGLGVALGVPPRLRLPLPDAVGNSLAGRAAAQMVASDGRYGYTIPPHLAAHGQTAPLGGIVLLDRVEGQPVGFHQVARNEALAHLLLRNLHRDISASETITRLMDLSGNVPATRMVYSDIDEAVASLMALDPDHWPIGGASGQADWKAPISPKPLPPGDQPFRHIENVSAYEVDSEMFVAHPLTEEILRLNAVAAIVWDLLSEPVSRDELAALLHEAFPAEAPDRISSDIDNLIAALIARDLIRPVAI